MNLVVGIKSQSIAKIVEPDLISSSIRDVAFISRPSLRGRHLLLYTANRKAKTTIDLAHPLGVTPGKIIVRGHHVDTAPGFCEPHRGWNSGQSLSFTGLHFRNSA